MLKKVTSVFVCVAFLVTSGSLPQAKAEVAPIPALNFRSLTDDLTAIALPKEIGKIQETFRGSGDKVVVLVQDAHSIPDAQRSIRAAIDHFQTQYGVSLVGLEGASEKLDPQIFRSFPDKELLHKTFEAYAARGELAGGAAAALLNASPATYHGIEDWPLYEEGVSHYLQAVKIEPEINSLLDPMEAALSQEKESVYSKELLEIDRLWADFGRNKTDLVQVLNKLNQYQPPPEGSELAVLLEEIRQGEMTDTPVEIEIKEVAEQVLSSLKSEPLNPAIRQEMLEFNGHLQEFRTGRTTPQAFAFYLKGLAKKHGVRGKVSRKLTYLTEHQKRLKDIEGTRLFEDFKRYADSVKESLFQNEEQKALDIKTRGLDLIKRLVRLELSFEDWGKIQKLMLQLEQWTVTQDQIVSREEVSVLFEKMKPHLAFYRVAEKRDKVFLENIRSMMDKAKQESSLLVAGGFHTEGLTRELKEKGISYVLVMPRIGSIPEEPLYREHMQGQVSWSDYFEVKDGKVNLYDAFVRDTRDKLLGDKNASAASGKEWRDQIIRDLATEGRITEAGDYTRFIDELTDPRLQTLREQWLANIDRFGEGLKKLQTAGTLSESSILQLIKTITIPAPADGVAVLVANGPSVDADLVRGVVAKAVPVTTSLGEKKPGLPAIDRVETRSESRKTEARDRAMKTDAGIPSAGIPKGLSNVRLLWKADEMANERLKGAGGFFSKDRAIVEENFTERIKRDPELKEWLEVKERRGQWFIDVKQELKDLVLADAPEGFHASAWKIAGQVVSASSMIEDAMGRDWAVEEGIRAYEKSTGSMDPELREEVKSYMKAIPYNQSMSSVRSYSLEHKSLAQSVEESVSHSTWRSLGIRRQWGFFELTNALATKTGARYLTRGVGLPQPEVVIGLKALPSMNERATAFQILKRNLLGPEDLQDFRDIADKIADPDSEMGQRSWVFKPNGYAEGVGILFIEPQPEKGTVVLKMSYKPDEGLEEQEQTWLPVIKYVGEENVKFPENGEEMIQITLKSDKLKNGHDLYEIWKKIGERLNDAGVIESKMDVYKVAGKRAVETRYAMEMSLSGGNAVKFIRGAEGGTVCFTRLGTNPEMAHASKTEEFHEDLYAPFNIPKDKRRTFEAEIERQMKAFALKVRSRLQALLAVDGQKMPKGEILTIEADVFWLPPEKKGGLPRLGINEVILMRDRYKIGDEWSVRSFAEIDGMNDRNLPHAQNKSAGKKRAETRSESRVVSQRIAEALADALDPRGGRGLDPSVTSEIESCVVKGDLEKLIALGKLLAEKRTAKAGITATPSGAPVLVKSVLDETTVKRIKTAMEAKGIKGNLTVAFADPLDVNFIKALQVAKDAIGTAVIPAANARDLDRKVLEGLKIQTVKNLDEYNPIAAENSTAIPVLADQPGSGILSKEELFVVGAKGDMQGDPFLEEFVCFAKIVGGLFMASQSASKLSAKEINAELCKLLFQLDVAPDQPVFSMEGRHLVIHRSALLAAIQSAYLAQSETQKSA